jgi:hypothetical protein
MTPTERLALTELLTALREQSISPEQSAQLNALLREHGDARARYLEYQYLCAALHWLHGDDAAAEPAFAPTATLDALLARPGRTAALKFLSGVGATLTRPVLWSVLGVGILFASYVVAITWNMLDREPQGLRLESRGESSPQTSNLEPAFVSASENAKWQQPPQMSLPAARDANTPAIAKGKLLQLASGIVELKLKQGVTLLVKGPAQWSIDGDNRATLTRGKLIATVPKQAIGFTVKTPTSEIVDLGTRFAVEVTAAGVTNVNVMLGLVDARPLQAAGTTVRLSAGQAARIAPASLVPESIPYDAGPFGAALPLALETERPASLLPTLPKLTEATLLFGDNFKVNQPSKEIHPGTNDAADRQTGLMAPLDYLVSLGDLTASAQLGHASAPGQLLLLSDVRQNRTCFGPACNFVQPEGQGGQYTVEFTTRLPARLDHPEEASSLWLGVHVGADRPDATAQSAQAGISFLLQGTGRYSVLERQAGRKIGNLADQLSISDLQEPIRVRITWDVAAFDGQTPAAVRIEANDRQLANFQTSRGFFNNYVLFEYLHGETRYSLGDFKVSFHPREEGNE